MKSLFSSKLGAIFVALSLVAAYTAGPAQASTVDTSMCETAEQSFSQPFQYVKDSNWYTLAPGQSTNEFEGAGWELSKGASISSDTIASGNDGSVLEMPSGSKAVSPPMCVTSEYPSARMMVRSVTGSPDAVNFYVGIEGTSTWNNPKPQVMVKGTGSAWTTSGSVPVMIGPSSGWQIVRFTLIATGKTDHFHIYDLYVDPRMSR